MSDTPRTDRSIIQQYAKMCGCVYSEITFAGFARQLERELNAAKAENEAMLDAVSFANHAICDLRLFTGGECDMSLSTRALNKLRPFLK